MESVDPVQVVAGSITIYKHQVDQDQSRDENILMFFVFVLCFRVCATSASLIKCMSRSQLSIYSSFLPQKTQSYVMFVFVITGPLPGHPCPSIRKEKKAANKKNESKKRTKVEVRPHPINTMKRLRN
jgi:hypothetical protein